MFIKNNLKTWPYYFIFFIQAALKNIAYKAIILDYNESFEYNLFFFFILYFWKNLNKVVNIHREYNFCRHQIWYATWTLNEKEKKTLKKQWIDWLYFIRTPTDGVSVVYTIFFDDHDDVVSDDHYFMSLLLLECTIFNIYI